MTKKHFIDLADRIRKANERRTLAGLPLCFEPAAIGELAEFFQSQNPHFNRAKWLDYIARTEWPKTGSHPRTGLPHQHENDSLHQS
jgi:hypothetical protein